MKKQIKIKKISYINGELKIKFVDKDIKVEENWSDYIIDSNEGAIAVSVQGHNQYRNNMKILTVRKNTEGVPVVPENGFKIRYETERFVSNTITILD